MSKWGINEYIPEVIINKVIEISKERNKNVPTEEIKKMIEEYKTKIISK